MHFSAMRKETLVFLDKGKGQCLRALDVAKRKNVAHNTSRTEKGKGLKKN